MSRSRLSKPNIWMHVFGDAPSALCPCCNVAYLYRDNESTWIDGHIIPDKDTRWITNILMNHRPICKDCNKKDNPFRYKSNFHYSAHLGTITTQEAERLYALHTAELEYIQRNPEVLICEKQGCKKKKKPRSKFCGTHKKQYINQLKKEEEEIAADLGRLITDADALLRKMQNAGIQKYYNSLKSIGFLFSDQNIGQLSLPPLPDSPPPIRKE